jgi:hypothetical protein
MRYVGRFFVQRNQSSDPQPVKTRRFVFTAIETGETDLQSVSDCERNMASSCDGPEMFAEVCLTDRPNIET